VSELNVIDLDLLSSDDVDVTIEFLCTLLFYFIISVQFCTIFMLINKILSWWLLSAGM